MSKLLRRKICNPISNANERHNHKQLAEHGRTEFTAEEFDKIPSTLKVALVSRKPKKLRDLYPLDTADGKRIWVEFLNRHQWCQNEFLVSNQITVEGRKKCRYDVTILVNGLPLVQIELKKTWRGTETGLQPDSTLSQDIVSRLVRLIPVVRYLQWCQYTLFRHIPTADISSPSIGRMQRMFVQ